MLAGKAVVAIWNDIAPEGRAEFYDWHINEHIPERLAIPGFRRGRRFVALNVATRPEFFTLYETDDFAVLQGPDYAARLEAPTPWTRTATSHFRHTARALAHVLHSEGPGSGGAMLTVRFDADATALQGFITLLAETMKLPRICGAHLCRADQTSSQVRTAESRERTDIEAPPTWFAVIEATDAEAILSAMDEGSLKDAGVTGPMHRGFYRVEFDGHKPGAGSGL